MSSPVTATFLVTDLVDSTVTAARLGPEAANQLQHTHFRLVRSVVAASGGSKMKFLGHCVMVMCSSSAAPWRGQWA